MKDRREFLFESSSATIWDVPGFKEDMVEKATSSRYLASILGLINGSRENAVKVVTGKMLSVCIRVGCQAAKEGIGSSGSPVCGLPFPFASFAYDVKKALRRRWRRELPIEVRQTWDVTAKVTRLNGIEGYDWHVVALELVPLASDRN